MPVDKISEAARALDAASSEPAMACRMVSSATIASFLARSASVCSSSTTRVAPSTAAIRERSVESFVASCGMVSRRADVT